MTFVHETHDESKSGDGIQPARTSIASENLVSNSSVEQPHTMDTEGPMLEEFPQIQPDHQLLPLGNIPQQSSIPVSPPSDDSPVLSLREASLMRCFIQKIAPWVSDTSPRFREYPRSDSPRRTFAILNHTSARLFRDGLCRSPWYSKRYCPSQHAMMPS